MHAGKLGALGGGLRMGVYFTQRKMPEYEPEIRPEVPLHSLHDRVRKPAVRTLVIAVFDERRGRVCGTADVVSQRDGIPQHGHGPSTGRTVFPMRRECRPRPD